VAVSFIGTSNLVQTTGAGPGVITPHASTAEGDLLLFFHYSRASGGDETVTPDTSPAFTTIFNSVTAGNGLVCAAQRIVGVGEASSTYLATITNHTSGTTGESVNEWIETYRGADPTTPILDFTASLSTWASSLNLGSVAAPASPSVPVGGMAVVFAGRFENVVTQTTLTGDSLTWAQRTLNNNSSGADAGAVTQTGLNETGSAVNVTAKTITTTGTAQAGAGRMFIINPAAEVVAPPILVMAPPRPA
jgi:hypothetical protein